jgi:hypothetical protein
MNESLSHIEKFASDNRAEQLRRSNAAASLAKLADQKSEILDQPPKFLSPDERDPEDKAAREWAAEVYLDASRESGIAAADFRRAEARAASHYRSNPGAYVELAEREDAARPAAETPSAPAD